MKLRYGITLGILTICTLLSASCATTTVTSSWKDEAYHGRAEKIVVIMVSRIPENRRMFEGRFVAELRSRGNDAIQSHNIISLEELPDRELVKTRIQNSGADAVLISRLVDSKTVEAYVPGKIHVVPTYYYSWGSYYGILFADYGYTGKTEVTYIETNMYDIETEKLIWSAQSKTERTEGEQQLINTFIKTIVKKLSSEGIIR